MLEFLVNQSRYLCVMSPFIPGDSTYSKVNFYINIDTPVFFWLVFAYCFSILLLLITYTFSVSSGFLINRQLFLSNLTIGLWLVYLDTFNMIIGLKCIILLAAFYLFPHSVTFSSFSASFRNNWVVLWIHFYLH